jgi:hypothetical protein
VDAVNSTPAASTNLRTTDSSFVKISIGKYFSVTAKIAWETVPNDLSSLIQA